MKTIGALVLLCIFLCVSYFLFGPLSPQRALPAELRDQYKEYYKVSGPFDSDFVYCLKTNSTKEQFVEFSELLKLQPGTGLSTLPSCNKNRSEADVRWNEHEKDDVSLIYENANTTQSGGEIAFYKDGVMYFKAWDH